MLQFKQQMFSLQNPKFNVATRKPFRFIPRFREDFTTHTTVGEVKLQENPFASSPTFVKVSQHTQL
jgi:hypothetical protein